jgi:formylglycine-generating enzyme
MAKKKAEPKQKAKKKRKAASTSRSKVAPGRSAGEHASSMSGNDEASFVRAMQEHPEDTSLRLVFADWLEERGDARGELIRLLHTLTQAVEVKGRKTLEERLRSLVASGVKPVGPFWTNSIGMKFAWIPAGTFMMGSPSKEKQREENETQHKVTLSKGFYLAVYPVTDACWRKVMIKKPKRPWSTGSKGADLPVEHVSWDDGQDFLRRLSKKDGDSYRLPTEAEWEYACRAGTTTPFSFGETISTDQANYRGNYPYGKGKDGEYRDKMTPVGTFPPNAYGLYDMHGNVSEWCQDWYGEYPKGETVDPQGPAIGKNRVLRGGSFFVVPWYVRSARRYGLVPKSRGSDFGFRVARTFP